MHHLIINGPRILSAAFLVLGSSIGAGILAMPTECSSVGFVPSLLVSAICCFVMGITGFFVALGVTQVRKSKVDFHFLSLSKFYFGSTLSAIVATVFLALHLSLLSAYFSGVVPYLEGIPFWGGDGAARSFLQVILFIGLALICVKNKVSTVNAVLTICMFFSFLWIFSNLFFEVNFFGLKSSNYENLITISPLFIGSFGYHAIVPVIVKYLKFDIKSSLFAIIIGLTLTLLVYNLWNFLILGSISNEMLLAAKASNQGIPFLMAFSQLGSGTNLIIGINILAFTAISTSIVGVGYAVYTFLEDLFKQYHLLRSSWIRALFTFVPVLLISYFYPNLFVQIFHYSSAFGESFFVGVFPVLLFWKCRQKKYSCLTWNLISASVLIFFIGIMIHEIYLLFM